MIPMKTTDLATVLAQKEATKKMSVIRELMPEINRSLERGLSKIEIWKALQSNGLDISYGVFMTYLWRMERIGKAVMPNKPVASIPPPVSNTPQTEVVLIQGESRTGAAVNAAITNARSTDYSKTLSKRK